jgi:hypothetical protein
MLDLRALAVAVLLLAGPLPAWAQTPLARVELVMRSLCRELPKAASPQAADIRARLAGLWRERAAILARLPADARAAALRGSALPDACRELARREAEAQDARKAAEAVRAREQREFEQREQARKEREKESYALARKNTGPGAGREYETFARRPSSPEIAAGPMAPSDTPKAGATPGSRAPSTVEPTIAMAPPTAADHPRTVAHPSPPSDTASMPMAPANTARPPLAGGAAPSAGDASAPQLEEFFPWPPPAPSDRHPLGLMQLGGDKPLVTWGDVADRLIALINGGHYPSWGFYAAPGGFAVIPRIEQLDGDTGAALAGNQRWAQEVKVASASVLSGILTVHRPQGIYRLIAFVLTTDPRTGEESTDPAKLLQFARRWGVSGALDLPQALRANPIVPEQRLFALVYEFESAIGGPTTVRSPGRWQLADHLRDAGIILLP